MINDVKDKENKQKILDAAQKVFKTRGFFGSRMQDIATEAGINKALLHYYFRSKENLFMEIFEQIFNQFLGNTFEELGNKNSFEDEIAFFISEYIDVLIKNPEIPSFILHEVSHNPEFVSKIVKSKISIKLNFFIEKILKEQTNGNIVNTNANQIVMNLLSLCIFPFAAKNLLMYRLDFNQDDFMQLMEERKKILPEMFLNSIRIKK